MQTEFQPPTLINESEINVYITTKPKEYGEDIYIRKKPANVGKRNPLKHIS